MIKSSRAFSIDGRSFSFEVPIESALPIGAYVQLTAENGREFLGQVLDERVGQATGAGFDDRVQGRGNLLAELEGSGSVALDGSAAFGAAQLHPADSHMVAAHLDASLGSGVGLELGTVQGSPGVPARLHARGFGRHTFLCGQSGSGKTYTLGILLERLLLDTDITIVVADPNSDFVNIATMRPAAETGLDRATYGEVAARYGDVASRIHVFGGEASPNRLSVRFGRLTPEQQTKVLGIDPIADPEIYNAFVRTVAGLHEGDYGIGDVIRATRASFADDQRRLGLRIENLGVEQLSVWAGDADPMGKVLPDDARMIVLDLGALGSDRESNIAAAALLGHLWAQRHEREPTIIVIDEAHNVCPQQPTGPNQELATEHLIRIAGEGRKFGLYLLLATQRPDKVHPNVVSQCDNVILMKVNSAADIASLSQTFSYAPEALVAQAAGFGLGEGFAAGKIAPDPLLFRSGRRLTFEGGSDVPSTWATRSGP